MRSDQGDEEESLSIADERETEAEVEGNTEQGQEGLSLLGHGEESDDQNEDEEDSLSDHEDDSISEDDESYLDYQKLKDFLLTDGAPPGCGDVDEIVEILQRNPKFAARKFMERRPYDDIIGGYIFTASPLCFLLEKNPELDAVQKVYDLYPRVASKGCLIHNVFRHTNNSDVRDFIMSKCSVFDAECYDFEYPIVAALGSTEFGQDASPSSLADFKKLLEISPEKSFENDLECFSVAVSNRSHLEIVGWLVEKTKFERKVLGINHKNFVHFDLIDIYAVKCIEMALPRVEEVYFEPVDGFTMDGLEHMFKAFNVFKENLKEISVYFPPTISFLDFENNEKDTRQMLLGCLTGESSAIERFRTGRRNASGVVGGEIPKDGDAFLWNEVAPCLRNKSPRLKWIDFSVFTFLDSDKFLEFLLSDLLPPKALFYAYIENDLKHTCNHAVDYSKCRLECLHLGGSIHKSILEHIPNIPLLSEVCLICQRLEASELVFSLLKTNKIRQLELLFWDAKWYDVSECLLSGLKTNTSLVSLMLHKQLPLSFEVALVNAVLKVHNTSLEGVHYHVRDHTLMNKVVWYYLLLNKLGRGKLRNCTTSSLQCLVEALSGISECEREPSPHTFHVESNEIDRDISKEIDDDTKTSLWYGLIREAPGLLSAVAMGNNVAQHQHSSKRRKIAEVC